MDFYQVRERETKNGIEVWPDFIVRPSKDLMVRGGSFYAVWDDGAGLWSTDEYDVQRLVDADLYAYADKLEGVAYVKALSSFKSNLWKEFRSYIGNLPNSHKQLDGILAFKSTPPRKSDYSSKKLPYDISAGAINAYDKLMSTLFSKDERAKLEWAMGSVLAGDSPKIQKFFVLYGEGGTGKSTFLDILEKLFEGYTATFDAKAITGTTNAFSTESFKDNPLVAIQHDADLSRIEDNTRLNSIVSHEEIIINEKYKSPYPGKINAMLFLGTNSSVKITDAKSGLIRRLIDVHPTGDKLPPAEYEAAKHGISFELGAIAHHCLEVYRRYGKNFYAAYKPVDMIIRTDVFYNFLMANYEIFKEHDGTTLKQAWALYKAFCDEGGYDWRLNQSRFRDELRNYFDHFSERGRIGESQVWNLFTGFRSDKLGVPSSPELSFPTLVLDRTESLLDGMLAGCQAQYASEAETPAKAWAKVKSTLADLDTSRLHYVKPGENHVVIDFDLRDDSGDKSLAKNLTAASLWPPTYAELSKSGSGVHLHYAYDGDVSELANVYDEGIEVKAFQGDSSLRRKLTTCNDIPIATISSGLPRKERRVIDADTMKSERALRDLIARNLRKEIHPGTKSSIDFIAKILDDAWNSGMTYDVTDLRGKITAFANNSTHHSLYCIKVAMKMRFASEPVAAETPAAALEVQSEKPKESRLVFFDVEVFPNFFGVCWKYQGSDTVVKMLNPTAHDIEHLLEFKLVGFYNRRYDNHILWARLLGYNNEQLYQLSKKITSNAPNSMFGEAFNVSWADIWDFSSEKKSLKRFQIELGLNHKELGLPWDEPVPDDKIEEVMDYCANDVITTEQVFESRAQDYVARQILADLAGMTVNDTTQKLTARIIFGDARRPQEQFKYTDLATIFPGYEYDFGKSTYLGETVGEGGYVYAEPGMYENVAVLDVASMHPTSLELLDMFGPYTSRFSALKAARIAIKRRDYDGARGMLNGALAPYLTSPENSKALSYALKIAINIVYGLTSASFDNPFRDPRNKDNIAAKRGALFMITLKKAIQDKGFKVVHIKTDSVKIPDATPDIIRFIMQFGEKYGYEFEHEVTYSKMCLVNDAVYIAKSMDALCEKCDEVHGEWHATGAQFAHPYVFKTLFSGEPIVFRDLCETKTVSTALYLDYGDGNPKFVGRAGSFVPVSGETGGILLRGKDGQFHAASGTKGYFWQEAAIQKEMGHAEDIDMRYFRKLVDDALENISRFGDPERFRE